MPAPADMRLSVDNKGSIMFMSQIWKNIPHAQKSRVKQMKTHSC